MEIKCQEPCIRRVLKEKEKKQQAQPLNPRPVVVGKPLKIKL